MTREEWLAVWGYTDGTPEAAMAWEGKLAFQPQHLNALIAKDIEPYQAMGVDIATGNAPIITSRSQHRDYIRRNGYVEIGNEKMQSTKPTISKNDIVKDIKKTIEQLGVKL